MSFAVNVQRAAAPHPRTLLDIFQESATRFADNIAIDAGARTMTYRRLSAAAEDIASRLRAQGVGPGDRVGVRIPSGTGDLYTAILGVLMSGAAYVPVDFDDPAARVADVLERSSACAVIHTGLAIERLTPAAGHLRPVNTDDDAWVIFTSGSTGAPKGVAVSHRSAAAFVDAEAALWEVHPEDRVLAGLSVAFDASCEEIWLAWRHGATLVPAPRTIVRAGVELGPWLVEHRITVLSTVPTLAALWDDATLAGVRLIILGGEACPEPLAWRLAADREVWNTYGPTEATVVSTAARLAPGEPVTIGTPLDGWEVAILDEDGIPVAHGEPGELVIAGAGVARYLDPLLDTERFPPIPSLRWDRAYPTGDIVRETPNGLAFVGRRDHQVKIGGRRIELGEIDAELHDVPGVRTAVTVVRESTAGNRLLVAYVSGDVAAADVRSALAGRLPEALVPVIVVLEELPVSRSGKVDREALPWPAPASQPNSTQSDLSGTERWLADRWIDQLGPIQLAPDSDFFVLGGSSLAAAKLVSTLRERFPTVAVADLYAHRSLRTMSARLDQLGTCPDPVPIDAARAPRRWAAIQLCGVLALFAVSAPPWLIGILAIDDWHGGQLGLHVGWVWLLIGWIVLVSAPGRALIVLVARRLLLGRLKPGRYPRYSSLTYRIWFLERLTELCHLDSFAGTPWATRYARISGHQVGAGARLGTLPPPVSLISIGAGATLEPDVDLHGWWIDGQELVVGELTIGAGARVGTRALLMPGASIGAGAEVEPGALVGGPVPDGERWAGSPAQKVGVAGTGWREPRVDLERSSVKLKVMYGVGMAVHALLPLIAAVPELFLLNAVESGHWSTIGFLFRMSAVAPLAALCFVLSYALLVAVAMRAVAPLIVPGWHRDDSPVGWAMWFGETAQAEARVALFPLYASLYTRPWLRLIGVEVGKRTEVSTAVGLNRLTSFGARSFATDDVVFSCGRARGGWLHVSPITVGNRTFLGNSAILNGSTVLGDDSLVGALSVAPLQSADGTSWFGCPALELPRVPDRRDPARTTDPSRRLVLARACVEAVRILLPGTAFTVLAGAVFWSLSSIGAAAGLGAMILLTPPLLVGAGILAALVPIVVKWLLIGRYRPSEHPLWSSFVWRDEIVNTCQEQLGGGWLLGLAVGTPILPIYLRLMGATVGRDVWCETLNVTEFDTVTLGDGCVINRHAVIETHLFHDRLMRIGPATVGAGATLGPLTAILPDTTIGEHCTVSGRSVVMRGERLPAGSRWHGAPVVGA